MADALALRAHQKGLELIVDVDARVRPAVRGDSGRLRQILVNLIGNALKFTQHGEVVLRVNTEAAAPHDVLLHFSVTDTGSASRSIFRNAFSRRPRRPTAPRRVCMRHGLGLTIATQLVSLMGGRLWVESEAGQGSIFYLPPISERCGSPSLPRRLRQLICEI